MAMDEKPFRVLLDARDLFLDSIKHIWISISPKETRTVLDLKTLIKTKLNLPTNKVILYVKEGLLLDEETIAVLREDDKVRVEFDKRENNCSDEKFEDSSVEKSSSNERYHEEQKSNESYLNLKKRKRFQTDDGRLEKDQEMEDTVRYKPKKHKRSGVNDFILEIEEEARISNQSYDNDSTNSNDVSVKKKHTKRKHKEKSLSFDQDKLNLNNCGTDNESTLFDVTSTSNLTTMPRQQMSEKTSKINCAKDFEKVDCEKVENSNGPSQNPSMSLHARATSIILDEGKSDLVLSKSTPVKKRKRKRKRKNKDLSLSDVVVPLDLPSLVNNGKDNSLLCSERKHIVFSPLNHSKKSFFNNSLPIELIDLEAVASTPLQLKDSKALDQDHSLIQTEHLPLQNGEAIKKESFIGEFASKDVCDRLNDSAILNYENLPPLSCLPVAGTKIAYKTLELDENYSPVVSDFREGVVKEINQKTDELIIELSKLIVKPGRNGKFELLKDDEVPPPEIIEKETVSWNALIEPKLIG